MTEKEINKYIDKVMNRKILTGHLEQLAVERHLKDLQTCYERGMYFDPEAGMRVVQFFKFLRHGKGRQFAGKPFELTDWQAFKLYVQYGWKRTNGRRRFRQSYLDVGRKNGKTTYAGGEALYNFIADGEVAAEIYTVATTYPQASICFNETKLILKNSPQVKSKLEVWSGAITQQSNGSTFKPLHSKSDNLDGLNPSFAIIDEFHAHPDNSMFEIIDSGMGSRIMPMLSIITTAGYNKQGPCYRFRDVAIKVLQGILEQDDLFAMIFSMDKEDDWEDEKMWRKSNPNLDISFEIAYLQDRYKAAKNDPSKLTGFKTKNLNLWVDAETVWLPDDQWQQCDFGIKDLTNQSCTGGLDLSSTRDLSSLCLDFQLPDGTDAFIWKFWMPEDNIAERVNKDKVPYDMWIKQGYITTTPGNVTDYDFIKADIIKLREQYKIKSIAYDRWNSSQLIINLTDEGLKMLPFGQGYGSMSAPTKEIERIVYTNKLNHMGNPVMRWMISNVAISRDPAGNIKVDKAKAVEKVDGVVAMVMAKGQQMTPDKDNKPDINEIYKERGIRSL